MKKSYIALIIGFTLSASLAQAESVPQSGKVVSKATENHFAQNNVKNKAQNKVQTQHQEFLNLSQSLMAQALPKSLGFNDKAGALSSSDTSPTIFIEQETVAALNSNQLANEQLLTGAQTGAKATGSKDGQGQWSVSFDLSRIDTRSAGLDLDSPFYNSYNSASHSNGLAQNFYDWELGSSLVSADKTSRFYVNYGNKKVPISISFDDESPMDSFSQQDLNLGFEQSFDQNWAVSIAYLKTDQQLERLGQGIIEPSPLHEVNYSFDISKPNQVETLNFSPFNQASGSNFLFDDVSAIEIKVSRQFGQSFSLNAKASELSAQVAEFGYLNPVNSVYPDKAAFDLNKLALEGQYRVSDRWSVDASLEKESGHLLASHAETANGANHFDATTLDIGVQYQSNWENVGVVIRIDLMNLLGLENADTNHRYGLDQDGLVPFSFDTPKYIKLSGSINF